MPRQLLALLLSLASCGETRAVDLPPPGAAPDAGRQRTSESFVQGQSEVDLLFVVDNTFGMGAVQSALAAGIGKLLDRLDLSGLDWRVGVVSSDLGIDPYSGPGCSTVGGDDAALQNIPRIAGCAAPPDRYITPQNVADPAAAFQCIATLGEQGCGFERPFEAALRAADPVRQPAVNKGFLRDTALLMLVWVTNEDDCSAADLTLYDPDMISLGVWSSYRCFDRDIICTGLAPDGSLTGCASGNGDYLLGVDAVAKQLKALKPAGGVVAVGIVGPKEPVRIQTGTEPKVLPACTGTNVDGAPAIRFHELLAAFGADGVAVSVCDGDLGQRLAEAVGQMRTMAGPYCLRHPLRDPGRPACSVEALLEDGRRISIGPSDDGSPGFRIIHPLVPGCSHGALDFDEAAKPPAGSEVTVTCDFKASP